MLIIMYHILLSILRWKMKSLTRTCSHTSRHFNIHTYIDKACYTSSYESDALLCQITMCLIKLWKQRYISCLRFVKMFRIKRILNNAILLLMRKLGCSSPIKISFNYKYENIVTFLVFVLPGCCVFSKH